VGQCNPVVLPNVFSVRRNRRRRVRFRVLTRWHIAESQFNKQINTHLETGRKTSPTEAAR
jgi:hypothetical protein